MLEKAGIFNTNNQSLGSICKLFSKCLGDVDLETSKKIIVGLSLYVSNMAEHDSEISEINFDSIFFKNIPLFDKSNFMFEYEVLGNISPELEKFDRTINYDYVKNLDNDKYLSEHQIGLEMKKYASNYIHNFNDIDDLVESIFQCIAYYIHSEVLTNKFTLKLPVGSDIVIIKLKSKFEKANLVYH